MSERTVEFLRHLAWWMMENDDPDWVLPEEAADEIEKLEAEVEDLTHALNKMEQQER